MPAPLLLFFLVFFLHLLVILLLRLTCSQVFLRSCLLLRELTVRAFSSSQRFAVLRGIAHARTPGCDSLHMKFYPRFWSILGADLVLVLNSAFASDLMYRSQRLGVITLSLKKGDFLLFHKIASRSVSARLLKVFPLLIDKDQSCGVPGRFIAENVAFIRDAVDHYFLFGVSVSLISLDQEKAFDRIGPFSVPWALTPFLLNGWICFT